MTSPSCQFLFDNFGALLVKDASVDPTSAAEEVFSTEYPILSKSGFDKETRSSGPRILIDESSRKKSSRFSGGWLIVRPGGASISLDVAFDSAKMKTLGLSVAFSPLNFGEALEQEFLSWTEGLSRLFVQFSNAKISPHSLFLSSDLRAIRLCSQATTRNQDWTVNPPKSKLKIAKQ